VKTFVKLILVSFIFLGFTTNISAQKKVKKFEVSHVIDASADAVWAVVGEDYGAVALSHPKIISSNYINGTLNSGEGAERVCNFNEQGTRFLKEKQVAYDPENYTFKNQVFQAGKFPVEPEYTYAIYKIEPLGNSKCKFTFSMTYRTKPAMMGGMMKGSFKKLIQDYAIAVEHYVKTGVAVNKDNFKEIKKSRNSK